MATPNGHPDSAPAGANAPGAKVHPKETVDEKFEKQKRVLQRMTHAWIDSGCEHGLAAGEVVMLRDALGVLGWLPPIARQG